MIAFSCPGCSQPFNVNDEFAGRQTKCRSCGRQLTVPSLDPEAFPLVPQSAKTSHSAAVSSSVADQPTAVEAGKRAMAAKRKQAVFGRSFCLLFMLLSFLVAFSLFHVGAAMGGLLVGALVPVSAVVAIGLFGGWGSADRCPSCGINEGPIYLRRIVQEKKKCYGLVTRVRNTTSVGYTHSTGRYGGDISNSMGHRVGHSGGTVNTSGTTTTSSTSTWEERVPVVRTTYLLFHRCKFCRAAWNTTHVDEVEDFDIDRS